MDLREQFWPLLGNWTGVEQQSASAAGPARRARSMLTFKLTAQDSLVVQDYRQVADDGVEATGHGVFRMDPGSTRVQWWYFDPWGGSPGPSEGGWRRGRLTLERTVEGGSVRHRFTCEGDWLLCQVDRRVDDEDDEDDGEWYEVLSGKYQRVSGH